MFILSDLDYIKENMTENGVTSKFLNYFESDIIPKIKTKYNTEGKTWKINSKIHRLRKHWFPALGNWHLDNVDRGSKSFYENGIEINDKIGQPDYINKNEDIYILFVIGESARTQLVDCDMILEKPKEGENVYQCFHKQIEDKYKDNIITMDSGDIILFTGEDFHRGSESLIDKSFFRYFIRVQLTSNTSNIKNKERKQVQTYIDLGRDW